MPTPDPLTLLSSPEEVLAYLRKVMPRPVLQRFMGLLFAAFGRSVYEDVACWLGPWLDMAGLPVEDRDEIWEQLRVRREVLEKRTFDVGTLEDCVALAQLLGIKPPPAPPIPSPLGDSPSQPGVGV